MCTKYLGAWKWRNKEGNKRRESKLEFTKCGRKDIVIEDKVSEEEKRKILCSECRTGEKKPWLNWGEAVWPKEAEAQQSDAWAGALKSIAKEEGKDREVRRTFKMLREV